MPDWELLSRISFHGFCFESGCFELCKTRVRIVLGLRKLSLSLAVTAFASTPYLLSWAASCSLSKHLTSGLNFPTLYFGLESQ